MCDKKKDDELCEPTKKKIKDDEAIANVEENEENDEEIELEAADDEEDSTDYRLKLGSEELLKRKKDKEVIEMIEEALQEGTNINNEDDN